MTDRRQRDYTSGSLAHNIWDLGLPIMAGQVLFGLPGIAESFWLGKLGSAALAAASMGMALRIVMISLVMGLSTGGMALVARYVGAGEQEAADRATQQTQMLILMAVAVLGVMGFLCAPTFLQWMGAEGAVLGEGVRYAQVLFVGLWAMELIPSMNALFRGAGNNEVGVDRHMIARILRLALPTAVERFMPNLARTIMLGLVAAWGVTTLAGYKSPLGSLA